MAAGAAGVLGLGVLGGGAVFAFSQLAGGGPQPETALPATSIGFAKVDLDPSADQKVDAFRFLRKFPAMQEDLKGVDEDDDLRKEVFESIQEDGGLEGVDYEQDIEPWLGQRFGVALLPADDGQGPDVVVALASTDQDAAEEGLAKVTEGGEGYCSVQEEFAICGEEQAAVDQAVTDAKEAPLAEDSQFSQDMEDLGEDGIVTGWFDGTRAEELDPAIGTMGTDAAGRTAVALRFDGPTLELAGRVNALPKESVPTGEGTSIGSLPADTLGAVAVAGLDETIRKVWPEIDKTMAGGVVGQDWSDGLDEFTAQTGLSVPQDIAKAVGSDTVLSVGPDARNPKVALRTNGDRAVIDKIVGLAQGPSAGPGAVGGPQLTVTDGAEDRVVVASDAGYADQVANGSGLGDSEAFKDAVPDADKAAAVGYVNVGTLVETFGQELTDDERANLEPLSAAGFAAWGEDDHMDFTLRLTTR